MQIEFDPNKDASNIAKHGMSLADAFGLDLATAAVVLDERAAYGATRYRAYNRIEGAPYCLVFTIRGDRVRVISFRRAHEKEMARHGR